MKDIRNIAIIAHVDHGKTTLLDEILRLCQNISSKEDTDRIMDSNDLEKERGITILSKNTAVEYKNQKINIIDTPGHSDFGGEVERVLRMVDACLLLVDAGEGPMPQTRFVLKKALELGHKILLVINKIDKPNIDIDKVIDNTFELFMELGATDEQIEFPIVYASSKEGYAIKELSDEKKDIAPVLDMIIDHCPVADNQADAPFLFQVTTLDYNEYLGRICIGRIFKGTIRTSDQVILLGKDRSLPADKQLTRSKHKITKLFTFMGLQRIETEEAVAGDIVAIAGIPEMSIGDTLCAEGHEERLERIAIEPPTMAMEFKVNDSPLAGQDGKYVTSRQIKNRLQREKMTNLSLEIEEVGEVYKVAGRGELHLSILIENMRREGYELGVSRPEVITKKIDGKVYEPYEEITIDLPEEFSGAIIQELNRRKGQMLEVVPLSDSYSRIKYEMPIRGLIGFRSFLLTETKGNGTSSSLFLEYRPWAGDFIGRTRGAITSMVRGTTNPYALSIVQERGDMFVGTQTEVYEGMIIGLHSKSTDLDVNPVKEKKLTNVRASGSDEALKVIPHKQLSLEMSLDFLENDELLEVTPLALRLRKKILNSKMRLRARGDK